MITRKKNFLCDVIRSRRSLSHRTRRFKRSALRRQDPARSLSAEVDRLEQRTLLTSFTSDLHTFSVDDIVGGFDGVTFAEDPTIIDTSAVLEDPMNPDPPDHMEPVRAIQDKDGNILFPIDSEFGFLVEDFVGAVQKDRDGLYAEGWAGNVVNLVDGEMLSGLSLANAATDEFKAGLPLGTWAAGLGGNSVKADTEHYVVMANILSDQLGIDDPNADYPLDNDLIVRGGDFDGRLVADVIMELQAEFDDGNTAVDRFTDGVIDIRDVLIPNENTITENIAISNDYSVTLKDDGKLLYRWGTIVKRPNDIRMAVQLDLPEEWNEGGLFRVTNAELIVRHEITNNPNEQIRPEDLENEAATGRLPSYVVIEHPDHPGDSDYALWVSPVNDFAGDGTFLPSYFVLDENGEIVTDAQPGDEVALDLDGNIVGVVNTDENGDPIGTILRVVTPTSEATSVLVSEDLEDGFTNAWYTSMDRDPFEAVLDENGDYIVGPRWRLKANKFGQDLPGMEIPAIPHSEPPFKRDNIKYEVGEFTTTTINLLDWEPGEVSPLLFSSGWIGNTGVTENGLQLTDQFDVAFYLKGDRNPTVFYDAQLVLTYEEVLDTLAIAPDDADKLEGDDGNTSYTFTVTRSGDLSATTTVDYTVVGSGNHSANADDFVGGTLPSGTITFDPEQASQTITVEVNGDLFAENDEGFTVQLSNAAIGTGISIAEASGVIRNDDSIVVASNGEGDPSTVVVIHPSSGQQVLGPLSPYPGFTGGVRVATGDVNGDGTQDIITAAGPGGGPHVRVFDGNTGLQLPGPIGSFMAYESGLPGEGGIFTGGVFVAVGDLNEDGYADIITGADAGGGPHVRAFSGKDQIELFSFMAYQTEFMGGVRVAAGDVTGDGIPDIITGAGPGGGPHVRVFDAANPILGPTDNIPGAIGSFYAYSPSFAGGVYVSAGEFDGLSGLDVVTAAGAGGGPHIRVASPANFTGTNFFANFMAYDVSYLGGVSTATIDWDNDGNPDILTGQLQGPNAEVRVFDGTADLTVINPTLLDSFTPLSDLSPPLNSGVYVAGTVATGMGLGSPLMAAQSLQEPKEGMVPLTQNELTQIAHAILERGDLAGLSTQQLQTLAAAQLTVRDLPGDLLGLSRPGQIVVDRDAAGYGWFIDPTPELDEEYSRETAFGLQSDDAEISRQMDLLTVVRHELAHLLGAEHSRGEGHSTALMAPTLQVGTRNSFDSDALDELFAGSELADTLLS